jgi:hypothetical protein
MLIDMGTGIVPELVYRMLGLVPKVIEKRNKTKKFEKSL